MQAMATLVNQARILVIMIRIGNSKIRLAMKKFFRSVMLVAVAAMGFVACQNEFDEPNVNQPVADGVVVTFVADEPATRTAVDTSSDEAPVFSWSDNESFAVLEQTDALAVGSNVTFEKVDGKANITATFAKNEGKSEYKYVTLYPASGYVSAESIASATLALPANQTMASGSYDPNADLMVSKVVTTAAQPNEAQQVEFTRLVAVVKMTLKNFNLEAGDEVEKVVFMADGKALAGTITADLNAPHEFAVAEGVSSVSVATTARDYIYFNVLPTVLEAGDSYTVVVITNKRLYVKQGSVPAESTLTLEAGMVNRFSVNMMGVMPSEKWTLVRDASTLKQGDIVTIAAKDYDKAISKKLYNNASETSTSAKRGVVDVSKLDNFLIAGNDVQPFTLVTGTVDDTFSLYDEERAKFLVSTTTGSTYLINQEYCNENTSFNISIDSATAEATIKNTEGAYATNLLRYNSNGYFVSNQNNSTVYKAICVYKIEGAVGTIPTIDANITVPDADESVVIAEEGATEPTAISTEQVTFNYVGEWTISVEAEAEWLSVAYDAANNCLTYTAEANTGAKRETQVTITASMEGKESLTWSFKVVQKGAPQEISIADLRGKSKDTNTVYKVTGQVTSIPSSATGAWVIEDENGNQAKIAYLKTDAGGDAKDNVDIKVGDVMCVTTVVTGTNGTYNCGSSTYPSIYKGHYGLKTTLGLAADYTGGSVNINVETYSNGIITTPEAVTATMAESDFAELSYSGGDTATVNFTSENTTTDAREAEVTFTYGLISVTVVAQQGVNPANKVGYELVTDASTLAVGDEVIIVAKNSDKALACPTKTNDTKFPSADIEKTGNVIYDAEDAGVQVFNIVNGDSEDTISFEFTYKDTTYYPYYSSGLKMRTSINAAASWTIAINEGGEATISTTSSSKDYLMKYNSATSAFTCYLSTATNATKAENAIAIYKKQK